jgi:hypothetical protein
MNWNHKFEMLFPLLLLTSKGKLLSLSVFQFLQKRVHNTVFKSDTKWYSVGFKLMKEL